MKPENGTDQTEIILSEAKSVSRKDNKVLRPSKAWTPSIHSLLRYLEHSDFPAAPRIIDSGFHEDGREMLKYVEGEFVHPGPWSDEALVEVGLMLRRLHDVTASFNPAFDAAWQPWFLRELGESRRIISHGDVTPWNMVTKDGMPFTLIDWEYAGPVDPLVELARVCWLFPQLHDDDVAEMVGLPPLNVRARQLRLLIDAYGVSPDQRKKLFDLILQVVVCETAEDAIEAQITPDSEGPLWGLAWRARSAAWILRNRTVLEQALS
jgi:hypothetical protein